MNAALDAASNVPFLGQQLGDIPQAEVFTKTLLNNVENTLAIKITDDSSTIVNTIQTTVQKDLFNLLGPSGAVPLLAAHDGSGTTPTASDVIVTVHPRAAASYFTY